MNAGYCAGGVGDKVTPEAIKKYIRHLDTSPMPHKQEGRAISARPYKYVAGAPPHLLKMHVLTWIPGVLQWPKNRVVRLHYCADTVAVLEKSAP